MLQLIDHDCAIVPRGAIAVDAAKKVITNANYQGLSFSTSKQLRAYMHMRRPENLQGIALLKRPGIIKTDDFLDCVDKDTPKGKTITKCTLGDVINILLSLVCFFVSRNVDDISR